LIDRVQTEIDPEQNHGIGLGMAPIGASVTISTCQMHPIEITATVQLKAGYDVSQVQVAANNAISDYYLTLKREWATPITSGGVDYAVNVYIAKISAVLLALDGVVNVRGVMLNHAENDLELTETATIQEIPDNVGVTLYVES
jgi:phage-related baseplate assembly protein